jgi:hypothetical protein
MKKNKFNATFLRSLLLTSIVLIVVVVVGGFYLAQGWLSDNAANSKTKSYTSMTSNLSSDELVLLQNDVYNHRADSIKATSLIAPDAGFENGIRQDLNKYAADIGMSVSNLSLTKPPSFEVGTIPIAGVEPKYISVTIGNPVQFTKLLEFIQAIETNIPKLRLTGIDITGKANQNGYVTIKPLTIEAYTK